MQKLKDLPEDEYYQYLDNLMAKYQSGKELTNEEIEMFCSCMNPELVKNYPICDDKRFYRLYLENFAANQQGPQISESKQNDLNGFYTAWEIVILNERHSDNLLKFLTKETRDEIKNLKRSFAENDISIESDEFKNKRRTSILRSKFIYLKIKSVLNQLGQSEFKLMFNGSEVEVDEYTYVHLLFRHFGQLTKPEDFNKTYFTQEVQIEEIPDVIQFLLESVDISGFSDNEFNYKIAFKYKDRFYRIYFKEATRQEKGKGNVKYLRVNTFYPIEEPTEINDLKNNYEEKTLQDYLKLYIKKKTTDNNV